MLSKIDTQIEALRQINPLAFSAINIAKIDFSSDNFSRLTKASENEFTPDGRGEHYLDSIKLSTMARAEGVIELLSAFHPDGLDGLSPTTLICDLLAGDGYVNTVAQRILSAHNCPSFINSDISGFMVESCIRNKLFAVWQGAADQFWVKDNAVDGVLMAYGTHHIPLQQRPIAVQESMRILRRGGTLVLHDFEQNSPVARWFANVVSTYSITPHDYPHFTEKSVTKLFSQSRFRDIEVYNIPDPFVFQAQNKSLVLELMADYVVKMYGLEKLKNNNKQVIDLLDHYFGITITKHESGNYEARIVRNALVCKGRKL